VKKQLTYSQDLENSSQYFKNLGNDPTEKPDEINSLEWERRKYYLSTTRETLKWKVLWNYVELWMEIYHPDVWADIKDEDGKYACRELKMMIRYWMTSLRRLQDAKLLI
jgi:hypothetical protein